MTLEYNKEKKTISIDTTSKLIWIVQLLIVVVLLVSISTIVSYWNQSRSIWFLGLNVLSFYLIFKHYTTYKKQLFKKEVQVEQIEKLKEYLTSTEVKYDLILKNGKKITLGSIPFNQLQKTKSMLDSIGIGFIPKNIKELL